MRTRPLLPALLLLAVLAARAPGQANAPADAPATPPATPAPATTEPAPPPAPEVTIKAVEPAHPVATKGHSAGGQDTLSVDFPETDIRDILRNVADLFELNLVIPETLQGKSSIKLRDVTWRQIFQAVLDPVGYTYVEDGNIIKIVSNEMVQQEPVSTEVFVINNAKAGDLVPTLIALIDPSKGGKIVVDARSNSLVITESPTRMNRIRPIIEKLDRATAQVMIESKFVDVTDTDMRDVGVNWASLQGYKVSVGGNTQGQVGTYQRDSNGDVTNGSNATNGTSSGTSNSTSGTQSTGSTAANTITSTNGVITATGSNGVTTTLGTTNTSGTTGSTTDALNLLNSLAGGTTNTRMLNAVFSADQFGVILSALNRLNSAKVVSNPTVVTLNNTEATINIGRDYPLPKYTYSEQKGSFEISGFDYRSIGINLKVTPQVNAQGFIRLSVDPEVSSTTQSVAFGGASGTQIPIIDTKKAHTQISLKDGYTMGIGGLLDQTLTDGSTKVPVLGSIPLLGRLFSSKSKNYSTHNLLIFLTAKTLPPEGAPIGVIFDPRQVRQMKLRPDDLPGFRDQSDPFGPGTTVDSPDPVKKKTGFFHRN